MNAVHRLFLYRCGVLILVFLIGHSAKGDDPGALEAGFANPPPEARVRAYWWWLNGNVTKEAITRDLEEMAAKGWGGAVICDASGAQQNSRDGNQPVPHGPTFFSAEWRELYKHALREADRLGLEMSLSIQSGWNLGGPMIQAQDAPKRLVWSSLRVKGPKLAIALPAEPEHPPAFYKDVTVLAYPIKTDAKHAPLQLWEEKSLQKSMGRSAPDTSALLRESQAAPGEEDYRSRDVVDLTARLGRDGSLNWSVPKGEWEILRLGCTINESPRVMFNSEGWDGYALDPFDVEVFRSYWQAVVEPLIADAGPLAGRTLKYLHTDSWEIEMANWTPTLREEFRRQRGYDLLAYLPVIAGRIVESRDVSNRFLHDFRKTMGDLAVDHHFRPFAEWAAKHGLGIHPESGGPHELPIDSLRCLGVDDSPMSEFWARSWKHRVTDEDRFFVKQPASAAHTYGHRVVRAEGFTTVGPHWQETLWDNLKPTFDQAACEGLNMLVWHAFTCSPVSMGVPGQQYFAGTHMNPNSTWWDKSSPFIAYLNRLQFMLQRGLFVADVVYYYGDHVPNYTQRKQSDPARVLPGFDYDVATEEVVLTRMSVKDGRIELPEGMSYRVLVLADQPVISLPVLRKIRQLVADGATVVGRRPQASSGLQGYPESDREVERLANELWGRGFTAKGENRVGRGRVVWGKSAREVLLAGGTSSDFAFESVRSARPAPDSQPAQALDYIHRRDGKTDIYFVSNKTAEQLTARLSFRVGGKQPELWDPVTGLIRLLPEYEQTAINSTKIPMEFSPYGSCFVVFRSPVPTKLKPSARENFPRLSTASEIQGAWTVKFDPHWGGPARAEFPQLVSWTKRPEEGIRYYSGTATYRKIFDRPQAASASTGKRIYLNLGSVHELAAIRLNGKSLGIVWTPPFRVDVTDVLKSSDNQLEIEVVNFWPNRIIGDAKLPPERRLTKTNIGQLTSDAQLMESGLVGPVTLETSDAGQMPSTSGR